MKQIKALLLVAILALGAVSAEAKIVTLGVTAGYTSPFYSVSDTDFDDIVDSNDGGFNAGVSATVSIPLVSIAAEAIYTQSNFTLNKDLLTTNCSVKVNSIDIPVLVGLNILGPVKVEAGPRFSVYDEGKAEFYGETFDLGRTRSSVGYTVGLKFVLLQKLSITARFNGEFDGYETNFNRDVESFTLNHKSLSVSAGFMF